MEPDERHRPDRRWWLALGLVTLAGLVLRVAYVWVERRGVPLMGDPIYYHEGANLLADGKGFVNPFAYSQGRTVQAADHPPLYIAYLAAFSVVGITSVTGHLLASCLLGAASVFVAGLAGRDVAGEATGLVAAVLVALYPNVWRFDGMVLSETMVIFTVLLTVWLAYRCWHRPSVGALVLAAVAIALATLARSELLLLAPLLLVPLAVGTARRLDQRAWRALALSAGVVMGVLAPWIAFNLTRFDRPVLLSGQFEVTLAVANCDGPYYGDQIGYWDISCGKKILEENGVTAEYGEAEAQRVLLRETLHYMRDHAGRIPVVVAARVGRITGVYQPVQQVRIDSYAELFPMWVMWAATISYWALVPFGVAGAVVLRRRRVPIYPLLAAPLSVLATVVLFYASTRFRASAEGPLCILAAVGVVALVGRLKARSQAQIEPSSNLGTNQAIGS